jgi:uncharacterized tellurite resistance protein B-like protein
MVLRRFLGLPGAAPQPTSDASLAPSDTATVRRIVAQLEALPPDRARHLAGFAYILGRTANADMHMTDDETRLIERIVMEHGELPEAQAVLVVEIAKQQERLIGETEDYLVTREWVPGTELDERIALLRCCFLVGAADGSISAEEGATLNEIGHELLLDDPTIAGIRGEFTDRFAAVQAMRAEASANH